MLAINSARRRVANSLYYSLLNGNSASRICWFGCGRLAPNENNWLINPAHSDYKRIVVREVEPLNYDPRMFRKQRSHRRR
jgi:hypothetical protein